MHKDITDLFILIEGMSEEHQKMLADWMRKTILLLEDHATMSREEIMERRRLRIEEINKRLRRLRRL